MEDTEQGVPLTPYPQHIVARIINSEYHFTPPPHLTDEDGYASSFAKDMMSRYCFDLNFEHLNVGIAGNPNVRTDGVAANRRIARQRGDTERIARHG